MDRIVRRLLDLADLIRWCQEHSLSAVSVAEMELASISDRNASADRYNIRADKHRDGIPPWGYLPEQTDEGWRYVQDPDQVPVINEVVRRTLDGEPLRAIAHDIASRPAYSAPARTRPGIVRLYDAS